MPLCLFFIWRIDTRGSTTRSGLAPVFKFNCLTLIAYALGTVGNSEVRFTQGDMGTKLMIASFPVFVNTASSCFALGLFSATYAAA